MKTVKNIDPLPYLKAAYEEIQSMPMNQTQRIVKGMLCNVFFIDPVTEEGFFVDTSSLQYFNIIQHQLPYYTVSEILDYFSH